MRTPWRATSLLPGIVVLLLSSCDGASGSAGVAVVPPSPPPPAASVCRAAGATPVRVAFVAKEAVADELDGLRYFVQDWGARQKCFTGTVLTGLDKADLSSYQVLIVDVSHDRSLSSGDAAALTAFVASGRRVGVFAWPLRLGDGSVLELPLGAAGSAFSTVRYKVARGCGDWQYTSVPATPFSLSRRSYRYENFGSAIFTVTAGAPARVWASTLFCPTDPGDVMVETPAGTVAGFSIAYSVSLADNNVRATAMKQLVVDTIDALSHPAAS